ncbi:MAG: hypothetical protein KGZ44_10235 [Dethiobacter sp.]|nr:hypothetical protein [Dethiobacter sp.]
MAGNELEVLLKQHSLRRAAANRQVLQALHQANEALQQARQLIIAEIEFQRRLDELAGFNESTQNGAAGEQFKQAEPLPPWRLGQPPDLQ